MDDPLRSHLYAHIERCLVARRRTVVAIDGRCGAGKTTLASQISARYGAPIITMDDFFLPPELRTRERGAMPGGNVHFERFLNEVINPLSKGQAVRYRRFDCGTMAYGEGCALSPAPLTLVEGSYAHHPEFGNAYDIRVFLTVSPELQRSRVLARNGEAAWQNFERRWIPLEETYFKAFSIEERADYVFGKDVGI